MGNNVLPVFLSMALVTALFEFRGSEQSGHQWLAFIHFVLTRIRYFFGDAKWTQLEKSCLRDGLSAERSVGLLCMITNLFLAVVCAMFVTDVKRYMLWSALNLLVGTAYLYYERAVLIDPDKTAGASLLKTQRSWIVFNCIELCIFLLAAGLIHSSGDVAAIFPTLGNVDLRGWIVPIAFGLLFFVVLIDSMVNREFLFDETVK